nr:ATP synthase F0 subunit 6 [Babina holsti]
MMMDLFSQFAPTTFLGVPLILLAMLMPWLLIPTPSTQWINNRLLTAQNWFLTSFTKQLLLPLNTPAHKWAFLLTSLMIFLLSMNLLGLLPYTFTPTTQLSINLGLATPLWLTTVLVGFRNQLTHSLAHFLPEGTPTPLIPVLILIETISLFIRPLALGVRLTANLTAGHLLIHLISSAVSAIFFLSITASMLTFLVLVLLTILEIAVAMIQAYVFVLLLSLYLQENTYGPPSSRLPHS